mgnify:CR=1 FL=1
MEEANQAGSRYYEYPFLLGRREMEILAATELPAAQKRAGGTDYGAVTVDEGLRLLETEDGLREQVMKRVMAECYPQGCPPAYRLRRDCAAISI